MHLIYGEYLCNANAAARMYREKYPNAGHHPYYRVFINVDRSFSEGHFPNKMISEGRPVMPSEVLQVAEQNPSISSTWN